MRIGAFLFLLPLIALLLSCSSVSKKSDLPPNQQDLWLQAYARARAEKSTDKSCEGFASLSRENQFVLRELALIRARTICNSTLLLPLVDSEIGSKLPYLRSINEERILAEAQKTDEPRAIAQAWRAKALSSDRVREKLQFLNKALEMANKAGERAVIEEIQNRIYSLAPRLKPAPTPQEYLRIGNDYVYNRDFDKGRKFYRKIFSRKDTRFGFEEKFQARRAYRNSFKTQQDKVQYIVEAEKMSKWLLRQKADPRVVHESFLTWARALWTAGRVSDAKSVLTQAEKKLKGVQSLEEIGFVRGRMAEEAGDFQLAFDHFDAAEKLARDKSALKDRLLFSKAWALRKLGKFSEAATTLESLKKQTQDPFDLFRYHFWWARSLQQADKVDQAMDEYRKLRSEDTLGYYGLLAHHQLGESLPPLDTTHTSRSPASILDSETAEMIRALSIVQESEILEKYLNLKTQDLRMSGSGNSLAWLTYLKAYAQAGLYLPLFAQLGSLETKLKTQLLKENPDLLFPRKFQEYINPAAEKFGIKPEMMLAIIRQESAFNPYARSPADAFGLMQILPSVAKHHEREAGTKMEHHEDLYLPEVNVPIGAALLAQLSKKYRNQFVLTVAAYNANEKAIENWLKTRLKEDPLEFIEDIPYDETRAYVKLILRNFVFYTRLNQPHQTLAFPAWCLEDLQSFKVSTR